MADAPHLIISPVGVLRLVCFLHILLLQSVSSVSFSEPTKVPGSSELVKEDMFPYLFWKPEGRFYLPAPYPPEGVSRYGFYYPEPVDDGAIDATGWEVLPIQIPNDLVSGAKEEEEDHEEAPMYELRAMSVPYPATVTPQYGRHPGSTERLPLVYDNELFGNKNGVPFESSKTQVMQRKVSQEENQYSSHWFPHLWRRYPGGQNPSPLTPGKGPVKINYGPEELYDPDYEIVLNSGSPEEASNSTGDFDGVRHHFEDTSSSAGQEFRYHYSINEFSPAVDPYKNSRYDDQEDGGLSVGIPEVHANNNQSGGHLENSYSYNAHEPYPKNNEEDSYTYFLYHENNDGEEEVENEGNQSPQDNFEKRPGQPPHVPHWAQFEVQRIPAHTTTLPHIPQPAQAQIPHTRHQQTYHHTDQEASQQEQQHHHPLQPHYEDVQPYYKQTERHDEVQHPHYQQSPSHHNQELPSHHNQEPHTHHNQKPPTHHHQQPPEYHQQQPSHYQQTPKYHQQIPHHLHHPPTRHYLQTQKHNQQPQQQLTQYHHSPEHSQQSSTQYQQSPQNSRQPPQYYQQSAEGSQERPQYYQQSPEESQQPPHYYQQSLEESKRPPQYYQQSPHHYHHEDAHPPIEHQVEHHEDTWVAPSTEEPHQWLSDSPQHHSALFSYIQKTAPHHPQSHRRQGHRVPGRRVANRRRQQYQQQPQAIDLEQVDRVTSFDPVTTLVPGGLIVLGLALAFFYFNYVWYPTPVVTARLAKMVSELQPASHAGDDQGRAAAEVYEVFRSLEKDYSTLWSDSCRGRVVCKVHQEFPRLWSVTRATLPIIRSNLPAILLPPDDDRGKATPESLNTTHYLEAARLGTLGYDCSTNYESCPLPEIEVKKTLRRLLGIEPHVDMN